MYWSLYVPDHGTIRWTGYDDDYWWTKVADDPSWRTRIANNGNAYILDPHTHTVEIIEK